MRIQVIAAWPDRSHACVLEMADGATAAMACMASGLGEGYPLAGMAVFGRRIGADTPLQDGDRLELLRTLSIDPKEARRRRADAARALKQKAR